jgi:all-trans-retinol dehydrogenase (NAD+)
MVKQNKGHIVELASMSSFVGVSRFSDYSAGKAALTSFSESEFCSDLISTVVVDDHLLRLRLVGLREQLRGWYDAPNVHVTCVHPLWVATPMTEYRREEIEASTKEKMMTPSRVATEITDQIFRCRGTRLVIPGSYSFLRTTRAWPVWMLDAAKRSSGLDAKPRDL